VVITIVIAATTTTAVFRHWVVRCRVHDRWGRGGVRKTMNTRRNKNSVIYKSTFTSLIWLACGHDGTRVQDGWRTSGVYYILGLLFRIKSHRVPQRHITDCHVHSPAAENRRRRRARGSILKSLHTYHHVKSRVL